MDPSPSTSACGTTGVISSVNAAVMIRTTPGEGLPYPAATPSSPDKPVVAQLALQVPKPWTFYEGGKGGGHPGEIFTPVQNHCTIDGMDRISISTSTIKVDAVKSTWRPRMVPIAGVCSRNMDGREGSTSVGWDANSAVPGSFLACPVMATMDDRYPSRRAWYVIKME